MRIVVVLPSRTRFRLPVRAPAKALLPIVVRVAVAPELVTVPAWPGFSLELRSSLIACERPLRSTMALRPSTRRVEAAIAPWVPAIGSVLATVELRFTLPCVTVRMLGLK